MQANYGAVKALSGAAEVCYGGVETLPMGEKVCVSM
jgi:hypothetical protein